MSNPGTGPAAVPGCRPGNPPALRPAVRVTHRKERPGPRPRAHGQAEGQAFRRAERMATSRRAGALDAPISVLPSNGGPFGCNRRARHSRHSAGGKCRVGQAQSAVTHRDAEKVMTRRGKPRRGNEEMCVMWADDPGKAGHTNESEPDRPASRSDVFQSTISLPTGFTERRAMQRLEQRLRTRVRPLAVAHQVHRVGPADAETGPRAMVGAARAAMAEGVLGRPEDSSARSGGGNRHATRRCSCSASQPSAMTVRPRRSVSSDRNGAPPMARHP